jgi:hypothetical protein
MDGRAAGQASSDTGGLLRGALEKIVFFECRVAQLEAELAAARQVAERARGDAAEARTAETGAAQALAAEREARAALSLRQADLEERVRLLEAERERLLAGLVERARLGGAAGDDGSAGPEEGGADLASFIAELRAEIVELREYRAAHQAEAGHPPIGFQARPPARGATVEALAQGFSADGRTGLGAADAARLKRALPASADQLLYERAMADLTGAPPDGRLRAVRQLEALGARAAAPLLAAALGREPEAPVKVALLQALARFQEPFAAGLAVGALGDGRAEVRAAALETLAAVAEAEALPHLTRALGDRSPVVRRRAAVLLNAARGPQAEQALVAALRDEDDGVARAAAVALSGRVDEVTTRALARFQARRGAPGRRATIPIATRTATSTPPRSSPPPVGPSRVVAQPGRRVGVAVLEATAAPAVAVASHAVASDLEAALQLEVRGALRGCTAADLAAATGASPARVEAALEVLRVRGLLTLRGARWCVT